MTSPTPIQAIQDAASALATARNALSTKAQALNAAIEALVAEAQPEIVQLAGVATDAWIVLHKAIEAHPEVFTKPKTMSLHGIKFGLEKGKDKLVINDPAKTIKAIGKHMPDLFGVLVITEQKPALSALAALSEDELKTLKVQIEPGTDRVIIRPTDTAVDAMVKTLVKEHAAAVEQAAEGVV